MDGNAVEFVPDDESSRVSSNIKNIDENSQTRTRGAWNWTDAREKRLEAADKDKTWWSPALQKVFDERCLAIWTVQKLDLFSSEQQIIDFVQSFFAIPDDDTSNHYSFSRKMKEGMEEVDAIVSRCAQKEQDAKKASLLAEEVAASDTDPFWETSVGMYFGERVEIDGELRPQGYGKRVINAEAEVSEDNGVYRYSGFWEEKKGTDTETGASGIGINDIEVDGLRTQYIGELKENVLWGGLGIYYDKIRTYTGNFDDFDTMSGWCCVTCRKSGDEYKIRIDKPRRGINLTGFGRRTIKRGPSTSSSTIEGNFHAGVACGEARISVKDIKDPINDSIKDSWVFEGQIMSSQLTSEKRSRKYVNVIEHARRHSDGKTKFANGDVYIGHAVIHQESLRFSKHGPGKLIHVDGSVEEGEWDGNVLKQS